MSAAKWIGVVGLFLAACGDADAGNTAQPGAGSPSVTGNSGTVNGGTAISGTPNGDPRAPDRQTDTRGAIGSNQGVAPGSYTPVPAPGVTSVLVLPTVYGATVSTQLALTSAQVAPPILGAEPNVANRLCPTVVRWHGAKHPYAYVELRNDTAKLAVVSVWADEAVPGAVARTTMAVYAGRTVPKDDDRDACVGVVNRACCGGNCAKTCAWPGMDLVEGRAITIPAGGSVLVYLQTQQPAVTTVLELNAKVEHLQ